MMSRDSLVVGDGLDIQQEAVLRIPFINVDMSWARTVCRPTGVVRRDGTLGTRSFHGNDSELVLGKTAKEFRKFEIHFVNIARIQVEQLLAGNGIETALVFDVLV